MVDTARRHSGLVVGAALIALGMGCARADEAEPAASTPAEEPAPAAGLATVSGRAPIGAIIALEPIGVDPPAPSGPVIMDQYSRTFIPDLLFVRVGQAVEFRNSEDVDHNIRVLRMPTGTTIMDVSGSRNQVFTHVFDEPGAYDVSCDVHPGMRATIVATRTPYVAGTDARGDFALANVPAGRYRVRVTAGGRESTQEATIEGPRTELTLAGR